MNVQDSVLTQLSCLFIVFLFWVLALVPVRLAQQRAEGGIDNANPRDQYTKLDAQGQKALAVVANSFEALVFFTGAILVSVFFSFNSNANV